MSLFLVLLIYNFLLPFALLVLLPVSLIKMRRRGGYGAKFWQRFGFFDKATAARLAEGCGKCRWIHAVSVGEVNVARKLIRQLLKREPDIPVVLSVTTSTGYAVACEKAPPQLTVIYSPVDLALVVGPVYARIMPRQFILVEAEVWPNLVRVMQRAQVPVVLVNARLSPRSEKRYRMFRWFVAPVFGMLDKVLVQEPEDVNRWQDIGAKPGHVEVTGSIKFDQEGHVSSVPERVGEFRKILPGIFGGLFPRVVLVASSHSGEELALAGLWSRMRQDFPDVRLLIAPRHAERRAEVLSAVEAAGLSGTLRSMLPVEGSTETDVLIIDSTGELRDWQALAEVVIIGKSFLAKGGQNPVEAIAAGVPVLTGPHMENFSALMKLLKSVDGIHQLPELDFPATAAALRVCLENPAAAKAMAERGRGALGRHAGATRRTAEVLKLA